MADKIKVWIVDDDETVREIIKKVLERDGYQTREFPTSEGVLEALTDPPDIIILDVKLPNLRGTDLCRDIRARSSVPVIFLSSMDTPFDKVIGLEVGADDYISKPFEPRELTARIRAVIRRHRRSAEVPPSTTNGGNEELSVGILTMDPVGFRTFINGEEIQLTKIEFEILRTLMSEPERVFSRESLMESAYEGVRVSKKTIDSHVHRVRANFVKFDIDPIRTVRGFGYAIDVNALKG